jgi:hypothetical protein
MKCRCRLQEASKRKEVGGKKVAIGRQDNRITGKAGFRFQAEGPAFRGVSGSKLRARRAEK